MSNRIEDILQEILATDKAALRRSRKEVIADTLKTAILKGVFEEVDVFPSENALAKIFGVSRTTIREAIKSLEAQSLVKVIPGVGITINDNQMEGLYNAVQLMFQRHQVTAKDLLEIRCILEPCSARMAAERALPSHIKKLGELLEEFKRESAESVQTEVDVLFHITIAQASGNPIMSVLIESIRNLFRDSIQMIRKSPTPVDPEYRLKIHTAIFQAIREKNTLEAEKAMVQHLILTKERLNPLLEQ